MDEKYEGQMRSPSGATWIWRGVAWHTDKLAGIRAVLFQPWAGSL